MSDQHRADMMGCAGDATALTPSLDGLAAEGVRFSRVSCQGPLCMPARASFMTERYVRDHGVYTNSSEIASGSPTYAWALREAGYHTALLGKAHLYLDEQLTVAHMDDMAGRLEALGFAEVFETGDKFVGKIPTRYTDYLAGRGLLDAYKKHVADRSYQGENEDGQDVGFHTHADPAGVLRRRLARPAGRAMDRALRPPAAVLPLRRLPRAA
jgi:arylsulfatase A-like enzyme